MSSIISDAPILTGVSTQAQVYSQGITYDNAGITYDNIGIAYGGVYNPDWDIIPTISLAENIVPSVIVKNDYFNVPTMNLAENIMPSISGYNDIYTLAPPKPNTNHSVGPGWFLFVTIP
jgi:hypothetical protein